MGLIGTDGKRHVKVKAHNFGGAALTALSAACDKWNALSNTTGIVFEISNDWGHVLVIEESDPNLTLGVAAYSFDEAFIYADPAVISAAGSYPDELARLWAHELGHYLGLDDNNGDSGDLMYQCHVAGVVNCVASRTQEPSSANATKVASCLQHIQNAELSSGSYYDYGQEPDTQNEDYVCDITWLKTDHYHCSGTSCTYWYTSSEVVSVFCHPMEEGH